ncbi:hypothetical protein AAZX31_04G121100 [Glycine max]|uniref:SHSP domain-containing protein n=2 Tax=Glycine subgen. Soja TaxID=1462606 RepID=I1JW02_SOYBN|nr:inactive protein RESTRICTED TEV MOVEMENT 2 [Glycine max]XP_028228730.1 inactive protein RESTRICTED TEV MOVEMENT 2-like [Glycine soja]KAG5034909.1 hypothetical protein JHK87_009819 [Glycine soja]KAG5049120.1 hypothetical protein JHK85_010223 [Glycine max]KAG5066218.1 hypothetical protein JHK86_009949 [Glycine max]KAH1111168.1 hypothetical protein GYH30_009793 [Glycine max]KAH1253838.1 Inactive protein RESTRICTED TEV MOVEMENT 2 [Glycine max]|eukprot:XP_003523935.1 inactive protein RESTRICTED TEV MOVEMENT 2 [Glycine max]
MSMQTYEDLEAKYGTEETPESILLLVQIPDGFAREHIGAKIEYEFARVRVHGERSLGNNRRSRFNVLYQIPEYCDINRIKAKFDGKIVTITIPTIPGKVSKKEAESNPGDEKEGTPTDDDQKKTIVSDQVPKLIVECKEEIDHEASTPSN